MQVQHTSNRLLELRKAQGMELYDVSAVVRVNPVTIWRWEHGRSSIPDDQKAKLAALFGVTRAYLMGWDEDDEAAA